ncbi:glycoside hydrolase family 13 protein [Arsenicicoccus piscis]|nr:glycoside hydrolase family 13 protein [Arsenicicoccus piscis]MCH8629204.1 glycoside hydrolase family 13 protein [Arsenicicoccus piscis]
MRLADHPTHRAETHAASWWRHAVIYQVYPRSWADSDGDGVGDLPGVIDRLPYLRDLGVDALWLSPFYTSPMADAGYDVADYRDIDPIFGSLADAERMILAAKEIGLRVIIDLVPNHTSDEHVWFQAALAAGPGSAERERYLFKDGLGADGDEPPTNWRSVFGGSAWTRVTEPDGTPGQWYLNLFDSKQPDLNWEHPQVRAEFHDILRFWLDRGVDGFRVDVAHGLVKDQDFPDWDAETDMIGGVDEDSGEPSGHPARPDEPNGPFWDQDGVHEIYRGWREVLNSYNPDADPDQDKILCAEAWVEPVKRLVRYVRDDEMHQAFNFAFLDADWDARSLRGVVDHTLTAVDSVGAPATWVLSNHDVVRHASRLGFPVGTERMNGIDADSPQPDAELGLRRARAATALMLALPGSAYVYYGEELGLPDHTTMPDHFRQDPAHHRTKGSDSPAIGRDGCRVPMPWTAAGATFGFGPGEQTWLPQPPVYAGLAVDQQAGVEDSTLELYRTLLHERRRLDLGVGSLTWVEGYDPGAVVAFVSSGAERADEDLLVLTRSPCPRRAAGHGRDSSPPGRRAGSRRSPMSRMRPPLTTSMTVPVTTPSSSLMRSTAPQARSYSARFLDRISRPSLSSFW